MGVTYKAEIVQRGGGLLGVIEHQDRDTAKRILRRFIGEREDTETYWTVSDDKTPSNTLAEEKKRVEDKYRAEARDKFLAEFCVRSLPGITVLVISYLISRVFQ